MKATYLTLLALPGLLVGCTDPSDGDTSAVVDDTAPDDTGTIGETDGTCEGYTEGAPEEDYLIVFAGEVWADVASDTVQARLFDTEKEWLAYLDTIKPEGTIDRVDFENMRVAIGFVSVSSTCGLSLETLSVTQASGEPVHVDVTIVDSSGGCDTACAVEGMFLVAVEFTRDDVGTPTVCARRRDEC